MGSVVQVMRAARGARVSMCHARGSSRQSQHTRVTDRSFLGANTSLLRYGFDHERRFTFGDLSCRAGDGSLVEIGARKASC